MSSRKVDITKLNLKKIGGRIAFIRCKKDLTVAEFAKKVGLTKGNISNLENHKYEPSFKVIVQIYKHFGISPDWLLTGDGEPQKSEGGGNKEQGTTQRVIEMDHADIIRRFQDKSYARDLNLDLVDLERLSPEAYRKVGAYIKGVVDGVRMAAGQGSMYDGPDRRSGERRQRDGPVGDTPGERRSGGDRRRAVGET